MKEDKSFTFRLPLDLARSLESECKEEHTSLNSKVQQILRFYYSWQKPVKGVPLIPVSKTFYKKILTKISEKEISELASDIIPQVLKNIIAFRGKSFNFESLLEQIEEYFKVCEFNFVHSAEDGEHKYVIVHNMGKIFSAYLKSSMSPIFNELGHKLTDVDITDSTYAFKIKKAKPES
jgi:hypothetical protein